MRSVRRTVLIAFAAWHGFAATKNLCEVLGAVGLPGLPRFGSGNLSAIEKLLASWHPPRAVLASLLAAVAGLEGAAALAFARGEDERAFTIALAVFTAFVLIDDAFGDYRLDETHRGILTLLLAGYLAVRERPFGD